MLAGLGLVDGIFGCLLLHECKKVSVVIIVVGVGLLSNFFKFIFRPGVIVRTPLAPCLKGIKLLMSIGKVGVGTDRGVNVGSLWRTEMGWTATEIIGFGGGAGGDGDLISGESFEAGDDGSLARVGELSPCFLIWGSKVMPGCTKKMGR